MIQYDPIHRSLPPRCSRCSPCPSFSALGDVFGVIYVCNWTCVYMYIYIYIVLFMYWYRIVIIFIFILMFMNICVLIFLFISLFGQVCFPIIYHKWLNLIWDHATWFNHLQTGWIYHSNQHNGTTLSYYSESFSCK